MTRNIILALTLLCTWRIGASAQSLSCKAAVVCAGYSFDSGCLPPLPKSAYACGTIAPFQAQCTVNTNACEPAPECPNCNKGGAPINFANGNTEISQVDLRIPGVGGGLMLVRTWNSVWPVSGSGSIVGLFGPGWRSNFEESVYVGSDQYLKYSRGDGGTWSFGWTGQMNNTNSFGVAGPANRAATLIQATGNWTLTSQNGEQRVFDGTSGNLLSITDRNGNATQLTYDASYRLITVTDPVSRHLYFSYSSPTSYLFTGSSSTFWLSLTYSYDGQGRL